MQRLNIDAIGPLLEDEEGFMYIIVIIDCFSRWTMCYPVRNVDAEDFAWALVQHIGIFGIPAEIQSDNGTNFCNKIITELTKLLNVEHIKTVTYSKEENSIVERRNKEVMRHLRAIVFSENTTGKWRRFLPFAQRICNAEVVSSLGLSPADIVFGKAINLDREILTPNIPLDDHDHPDMTKYVSDLIEAQRAVTKLAQENQQAKDECLFHQL